MDSYKNPLEERYSSSEMLYNFSPNHKFTTWRKLWLGLAEVQKELGLPISEAQLAQMRENINTIDYPKVAKYEQTFRHDVMAHIYAFGEVCPLARPILHLGVTSAFVGDNTDLIQIREGLLIIKKRLLTLMDSLGKFANQYKDLPTLGFTHYQPAQLTTVGKRATLWLQSLLMDWEELLFALDTLHFRGVKGTTGTAASFKELFGNDYSKIKELDRKLSAKFGFSKVLPVSGQTYDRKTDSRALSVLCSIAQSAHKFGNDLRLLQNLKEMEEPFQEKQIGSSAMAYKRNPMRCERMGALAKYVISLASSSYMVAATQWFERTLDDSANKRLVIPQAFLAVDAILMIWINVTQNLVVYPKTIAKHIARELPFMATENILMDRVKNGADRQTVHEIIRKHSIEAAKQVKEEGKENDLVTRLLNDTDLKLNKEQLLSLLNPKNFTGFAEVQTTEFLATQLKPVLDRHKDCLENQNIELKV